VSIVVETGTQITGLVGLIPSGCQTVSKMRIGAGLAGFRIGDVGIYVFTGYIGRYGLQRVNRRGVCE
jgi:hypothetical protein